MTSMTVVYVKETGHAIGALVTVPVAVPALPPQLVLDVAITSGGPALAFPAAQLLTAVVDAEFDDPLAVFGWRVTSLTGPDGTSRPVLSRLVSDVTVAEVGSKIEITVPRMGSAGVVEQPRYEVRARSGLITDGVVRIPADKPSGKATATGTFPAETLIVLVAGYLPQAVQGPNP
ncbi:hypothetical protein [Actinoplanes sp. NPDC023714]|uniref:hypothetical protein n=1 Tax=Actinoplanes sp. NPDC023714 TaxID=3154322 RepID=UPI00340C42A2